MTFDKEIIRKARKDDKEKPQKLKAERVRFTFPNKTGKELILRVDDFTSGQAMIEAAEEWAAKQ